MSQQDTMLDAVIEDLAALTERVEHLEDDIAHVADLRERVQRLEERTDMLRLIERVDTIDAQQRRAALWQHCVREVRQSRAGKIALTHDDVERVLHHPDVDRTTLYEDMRKVAAQTPEEIATYRPQADSLSGNAELQVNLRGVDDAVDASTLFTGGD